MYVFGSKRRGWRGFEWLRRLGLGFTNPVGTWRVLDVCLCCGGVGGVGGECPCTKVWCYACVSCKSVFPVYMAGPGICILCLADTCAS